MQSRHRRYTLHIGGNLTNHQFRYCLSLLKDVMDGFSLKPVQGGYLIYVSEVIQPHNFRNIEEYLLNKKIDFHRYQAGRGSDTNISLPQHLFFIDGKKDIVECHYEGKEPCFRLDTLKEIKDNHDYKQANELIKHLENKANIERRLSPCTVETASVEYAVNGSIETALYL